MQCFIGTTKPSLKKRNPAIRIARDDGAFGAFTFLLIEGYCSLSR
jgi:hypothetical protein